MPYAKIALILLSLSVSAYPESLKIIAFSPVIAPVGGTITIAGTGLTGVTSVKFGGVTATSFKVISNTKIQASVPLVGGQVSISVDKASESSTSEGFFQLKALKVGSFAPLYGPPGTTITIKGSGFQGVNSVTFGGIPAPFFSVTSDLQIQAEVPSSGTNPTVQVTRGAETAVSTDTFRLYAQPTLSSASPDSGNGGTLVSLKGTPTLDLSAAQSVLI